MKKLIFMAIIAFAAWQAWKNYPNLSEFLHHRASHEAVVENRARDTIEHLKLKVGSQTFVRDAIESGSSAVIPFRVDQDSEFDLTWGWRGQVKEEHWSGGMVPRGPMVQRHIFTIDDEGGVIYRTENKLGS